MFIPRPTIALIAATLAAAATATGCGSGGHAPRAHAPADPYAPNPKADAAFRVHDTKEVADRFKAITGDPLTLSSSTGDGDELDLARHHDDSDLDRDDRFGIFSIDVLKTKAAALVYTREGRRRLTPDANGFYWTSDGEYWDGAKLYGNVVLTFSAKTRGVTAQLRRDDAILSSLGKPLQQAQAAVPTADRPCAAQGMSIEQTRSGTCREGDRTLTIVNRGQRLRTPAVTATVLKVRRAKKVAPRLEFGQAARAKGRFVILTVRLSNTGDQPFDDLYDARLRVGDKLYDDDSDAAFDLGDDTKTFPLQPGEHARSRVAYDVPAGTAAKAVGGQGALVLPLDEDSSAEDATHVGAMRLR